MRWIPCLRLPALSTAAVAQSGGGSPAPSPAPTRWTPTSDGIVTREEAQAYPRLAAHFDAADTNKDGQLDAAEMNAHREACESRCAPRPTSAGRRPTRTATARSRARRPRPRCRALAERFEKFDANGDGKIARDEMHNFRMKQKKQSD